MSRAPSDPDLDPRLPQDRAVERGLLATIVTLGREAVAEALGEDLEPADFVVGDHRALFTVARGLYAEGSALDLVTVLHGLQGHQSTVPYALIVELATEGLPIPGRAASYARILRALSFRRALIAAAGQIARHAYDPRDHGNSDSLESTMRLADFELTRVRARFLPDRHERRFVPVWEKYRDPAVC